MDTLCVCKLKEDSRYYKSEETQAEIMEAPVQLAVRRTWQKRVAKYESREGWFIISFPLLLDCIFNFCHPTVGTIAMLHNTHKHTHKGLHPPSLSLSHTHTHTRARVKFFKRDRQTLTRLIFIRRPNSKVGISIRHTWPLASLAKALQPTCL